MDEASEYNSFVEDELPPDRPVFLTILGLFHLVGGLGTIWLIARNWQALESIDLAGVISRYQFLFAGAVLGAVFLASAIGAFLGKRWGWWLFAFNYVYAIIRYCNALLIGWQMRDELEMSDDALQRNVIKYSVRIIISLLILRYLFAKKVIAYFGWRQVNWKKRLGALVSAAFVVGAVGYLIGLIG